MSAIVVVLFAIVVVRLFTLQVVRHERYERFARDNQLLRERASAPRGFLRDRTGTALVDNVLHFEVTIPWRSRQDVETAAGALAAYLPVDTTKILGRFDAWRKRYPQQPFPLVPDADKFMISFVRENADVLPAMRVASRGRRRYREHTLAAHMLGYVGEVGEAELAAAGPNRYYAGDMVGKTGLELQCEDWLRGEDGVRVLEVNAAGTVLGESKDLSSVPLPGRDVFLTIDADLQRFLEGMLAEHGAGAAVVLDVDDGAIIAAASVPSYDPNRFATGLSQAGLSALLGAEDRPLFNRFSQARYPPASTFKLVSTFAILTNDLIDPGEVLVYCTGARRFGNRVLPRSSMYWLI